ncbi:1-acyl-sn-glycerol-3-phosphate acyltransferase [Algoriphagus halophytocola]|uniref:Glycerol-3-phosphate acyltransferase n=1 Tax=Algoriphagus halophytocola TaxID=2991499 RepID=A0ABY6MFL8_9BACT|nr:MULTISPECIES: 1-acyl-sn-glycerol-3-phosphate acyltransferase [unclassified Algoriphagus]UZD20979.1 1-acyl-sn-glycerol-3-phosphate acyltransferase [Algoriphagus sp. TR-M5]WBL42145.1 1-acyl-sn-glycerol-3-phosphate acyltransferase [Algoriphagus sp. TR-M9]
MEEKYIKHRYEPIHPSKEEWPVVKLARERKDFVKKVSGLAEEKVLSITAHNPDILKEELETTLYREKLRIKQNPWVVDPDDEATFWGDVKSALVQISTEGGKSKKEKLEGYKAILNRITSRYAEEIASNFKHSHYKFTRSVVTFGFSRLLNAARVKGFKSIFSNQYTLQDKIQITGETDQLRDLASKGTVVMVPTHFSNLDSILIGWVISVLGLPPFIYGAGLNLFNISIFAYFMNSLGAYKVDRRKKNLMYLETLKTYSKEAIQFGCHSLFFPGGTRSRSGMIESKLKLGLLSTAIEAQRANFQNGLNDIGGKVFIVPVTINYHFVLEAPSLIRDHLSITGQERYYQENDEFSNSYKISKFLIKFFTKGSDISVSVGKAMDVLGNYVDKDGNSLDKKGRQINTRDYFITDGEVSVDHQREEEYTYMLGKRIVEEFHKINRVFNSHLVAFTAFELIKKKNKKLDLFDLLRLPEEDISIDFQEFKGACEMVLKKILELKSQGLINTAPHLSQPMDELMKQGIENVGMYHAKRPIVQGKSGDIGTDDMSLLYFYHNRLTGYGLEKLF